MAKCKSCGSPLCSGCSAAHMKYEVKDINKNGKIDGWEQAKYDAINKSSDSPAKQIGFGMANNAMAQAAQQVAQPMTNIPPAPSSAVNPFSPQAQANAQGIFGNQQMKQNAVNAPFMYSPLNQKDKKNERIFIGEDTDLIKKDKKGEYAVDMFTKDTLRPAGKKFNPNKVVDGYVMGGDYPATKVSNKNFRLKK